MQDNFVPEELLPSYRKAGKIAAEALKLGASMITPGAKVVDILDAVENHIRKLGGVPAFPAQISINEVAAHFCPDDTDETLLQVGDLVKLDCGAHVDGCVGDNAVTIDLSENAKHTDLIAASREARDAAIKKVHAGITPHEIGSIVHEVIASYGFEPIRNLSGHGVGQFIIHTSPSVPNYPNNDQNPIEADHVIAIEPFATTGQGLIYNGSNPTVFAQAGRGRPRSQMAREVLKQIETYGGLPFTTRWLTRKLGEGKTRFGLRELERIGAIVSYPPLPEKGGGLVAQSEHTVLVRDKPIIFTQLDD